MFGVMNQKEWDMLRSHCRVTMEKSKQRRYSIKCSDLLDQKQCKHYMQRLGTVFQTNDERVIASQFSKRYSAAVVVPTLFAMTLLQKGFDVSLDNCYLESCYENGQWLPKLRLGRWDDISICSPSTREKWREEMVRNLFVEHIAKVWESLASITGIANHILWENTAIYVYWLYETLLIDIVQTEEERQKIKNDFHYLLYGADDLLFSLSKNPLLQFFCEKKYFPDTNEWVRVRKTCCLYYKISQHEKVCSTCPKRIHSNS